MELVVNLRHRFRDKLQKIQWLDYEAKRKLNKVLSNTTFQIVDVAMLEDVIAKEGIYNNVSTCLFYCSNVEQIVVNLIRTLYTSNVHTTRKHLPAL